MAEEKKLGNPKSPLIGAVTKPTVLDNTTKLDIDVNQTFIDEIIQAGLSNQLDLGALEEFTSISNSRDQIYQLIDTMASDSSVSAIVRTYAEEVCEVADNGHIVWCESNDPKISKFVNYLLNVMNVDKNIFSWAYCLIKYGDVYLRLYRESDYEDALFNSKNINKLRSARGTLTENLDEAVNLNIHSANDHYSYYVEMVADPGSMFELTKLGRTFGYIEVPTEDTGLSYLQNYLVTSNESGVAQMNYRMRSNDVNIYQADDFVHASLDDGLTRYPEQVEVFNESADPNAQHSTAYNVKRGKSILYDSYKIWREKSLLEDSILLNRVTRSSVVRLVQVECANMPKSQVQNTLRRVKELFEQKSALSTNKNFTEYNNVGPVENNVYLATHGGQGAVTVSAVGGDVDVKNIADLDNWTNKFYSSYGVPKQYFGWTDDGAGFNGGTSLSILSSVFAKGVKRVQNSLIQMVSDIINLILVNKGLMSYLNNFTIKMRAPLTQEEINFRENFNNRVSAISNVQSLFSAVEDKGRQLSILKSLVNQLNLGDDVVAIVQEEIEAFEKQKIEDEKKAAEEAAAGGTGGELKDLDTSLPDLETPEANKETNNEPDLDLDLGSAAAVPANNEGFIPAEGTSPLVEGPDFITEEVDDLPTPEELDEKIDFTENK